MPKNWGSLRIGITGATGSLGRALTKKLKEKGAHIVGFSHRNVSKNNKSSDHPNEWVYWECGKEISIKKQLNELDILVINHGINTQQNISNFDLDKSIEINAMSAWRLIELFEEIAFKSRKNVKREIWINTSEAEIQPALSPAYEISKRLLGQLVSIKFNSLDEDERSKLLFRKLVLGPFKSNLNPIGIMTADFVASQIIFQASLNYSLIIVTPNPFTYLLMPLTEVFRCLYLKFFGAVNNSKLNS